MKKIVQGNVSNKHDSLRREDTFMSNTHDTQHNNMEEHIENMIPASYE